MTPDAALWLLLVLLVMFAPMVAAAAVLERFGPEEPPEWLRRLIG